MATLKRLLKTTFHRILRSPYQTLGAVFIMFLTFFLGSVVVLVTIGSQVTLNYFESKPKVIAFLKDEATPNQVEELKSLLISTGAVNNIKYVSKEEALKIYQEQHKDEPLLLEFVSASILPASLEVSATDISQLDTFRDILSKEKVVEEVAYQKVVIQNLTKGTKIIRSFGGGFILFLLLTTLIITLIVISLNIATYKDEIEIMRLVGATSWYIRVPFVMEGIFYGLIAALVATLSIWLLLIYLTPSVKNFFLGIPLFPVPLTVIGLMFLGELVIGILIGTTAALLATRKYLKV